MKDILNKSIVLVLNRNWQAIDVTTPAEAFASMVADSATALDIQGSAWMVPVRWKEWLKLPVRDGDFSIGIIKGRLRVPTIIVLSRFDQVPRKRPNFSLKGLWLRDGGKCQYTGRLLRPGEGNIDHVVPRSRGGETTWENCVLSDRGVNNRKADRTPEEAGLHLQAEPKRPPEVPVTYLLRNPYQISDWDVFLPKDSTDN